MSKPFFKKYAGVLWEHNKLIDALNQFLYDVLDDEYDTPPRTAENFFNEFKPIWAMYARPMSVDDDAKIGKENYKGFITGKINIIKSNDSLESGKNKTGRLNIPVFLAWMDEFQPKRAREWFQQVEDCYSEKKCSDELVFLREHFYPNLSKETYSVPEEKMGIFEDQNLKKDSSFPLPPIQPNDNATVEIADKIVKSWVPPQPLSEPKQGETWELYATIKFPPKFEVKNVPSVGKQNYYPEKAIWRKDKIRVLARNTKSKTHSRIFSGGFWSGDARRILFHRPKWNHIRTLDLKSVIADKSYFLLSDCWGLTFIAPDDDPGWKSYMSYGVFKYLSPSLTSTSGRLETYEKLPIETFVSESKGGSSYSYWQNGIAVSKTGKILHSVYTTTNEGALGQEGAKLILWQKSGRRNSSYEAEIILELKEEVFNKPIFSPSEKYVLFEDGSILCLDTRAIFKLGKNSKEARNSWSLHHSQPDAIWHPNEDILALIATKRFKEDKLICRVEIWDIAQNKILGSHFPKTAEFISCMDWSPDGAMIAFSSANFTVTIWNLFTNETHTSFIEEARICNLYFSPDGQRLSVQTVKNQKRRKAYIITSNDAEILTSFSGDITIFSESPWHRKGRHIGYAHYGTIQVRKLKFES